MALWSKAKFATKLALRAEFAKDTKLTKTLCALSALRGKINLL